MRLFAHGYEGTDMRLMGTESTVMRLCAHGYEGYRHEAHEYRYLHQAHGYEGTDMRLCAHAYEGTDMRLKSTGRYRHEASDS
ncbi:hypothetical protein M0R45_020783 [Rubus argutus]|uniref:Uncharacterized protein n=1 Tax=Rubus argutus TaxID=59490 RepID=A0AAW1XAJ2_RUBAR